MESKLSSDLFLGKMLWHVARNQNVGPDCDETLCRQRHKVSCTWQTKMTGTITPPVISRKTRILPPSFVELLFFNNASRGFHYAIGRRLSFLAVEISKKVLLQSGGGEKYLPRYQQVGTKSSAKTTASCAIAIVGVSI